MVELGGFEGAGVEVLEDELSLPAFDSAGFVSLFDPLDDSDPTFSELEPEDDFDA